MQIAQKMAVYSLGAADLLRRAMGKKIRAEMDQQRQIFVGGATSRGISEAKANEVLEQITQDPQHVDQVIERYMPYLCQAAMSGPDWREAPAPSAPLSPGEQELRQATDDRTVDPAGSRVAVKVQREHEEDGRAREDQPDCRAT